MPTFEVAAFYKFVSLADFTELQNPLQALLKQQQVFGNILLASEGINGTIAGSQNGIENFFSELKGDPRFADVEIKRSSADAMPFLRQNVKLKKEIVTLGVPGTDPNTRVGEYVSPTQWNALIEDPTVLVVDTRNQYEVELGTFKNAVSPETESFRDFPYYVQQQLDPTQHKKIAMFCTGGIRCEKASAYMLNQGFDEVYHLKGGILKYLEETPADNNLWQGECFVFDDRVAVDANLQPGSYQQCRACRKPLSSADRESDKYAEGISCPNCFGTQTPAQRQRAAERQKQFELAEQRREKHLGVSSKSSQKAKK